MDIRCPRCGEPWDMDCLHEEVEARAFRGRTYSYKEVRAEFASRGCAALQYAYGTVRCEPNGSEAALVAGALMDLMGDDMDGVAAMLEDYGY